MRYAAVALLLACTVIPLSGQEKTDGPEDAKAQKTYKEGLGYLKQHRVEAALEEFKKADKQDGGHCLACQKMMIKYGSELGDWKIAEAAAEEWWQRPRARALAVAHYQLGIC